VRARTVLCVLTVIVGVGVCITGLLLASTWAACVAVVVGALCITAGCLTLDWWGIRVPRVHRMSKITRQ
jgi:urea transporter